MCQLLLSKNIGLTVNQAKAGKKCMGTAKPGNIAGSFISNGSCMVIGIITLANDSTKNVTLK
jgi:hypothetical protein